ncbi:MAG: HAMP domain-containing protein [Deltaproteobacteria bacterium]|nr:HAMP domain-containing protein [Deltaproteobacteria bacterium]
MTLSIRLRLTLWYTTLLAATLVVFATMFYYSLFKIFTDQTDREINTVASTLIHSVIEPSGKLLLPKNFDIILERFFGIHVGGHYIQVLTSEGRVAAKSSTLENLILPLSDKAWDSALKGQPVFEITDMVGRYPVRMVTKPVIMKKIGLIAVVQVGSSMKGMEEIFHYVAYIFIVGIALSVIVASAVGSFLARKALKPVDEITKMARRIGAENLNERLVINVPHDEIGRLAATFNEMTARLDASFKKIKQFTADASHELKTPLTVLKGEIEVSLRAEQSVEGMKDVLISSLEEIDRMSYIVQNLLDLARADVEKTGTKKQVRLDWVVGERFEQVRRMAVEKGLTLNLEENTALTVLADEIRVGQLVFNLLDNAIKYTPAGGTIAISLTKEHEQALLKVRDSGIGISPEDLPCIFDRFYMADKARSREQGGAGLGLSICKEIAKNIDAQISAESYPRKGSVFTVSIPLHIEGQKKEATT